MLEELFSDSGAINQAVEFHSGINIILGTDPPRRGEGGTNGIGKSSLVRLIDYALLSEGADKRFSQEKYSFLRSEDHSITLKLKIQGESRFIRRTFGKNKKVIAFGSSLSTLVDYELVELRQLLLGLMFPITDEKVWYTGERFRTLMNFFIKDDLDQQQRSDPMSFFSQNAGKQEVISYNFYLMNLPNSAQLDYSQLLKDYKRIYSHVSVLQERIEKDTGKKIEQFESERIITQQKIEVLESSLKKFTFSDVYREIEDRLSTVTAEINIALKEYYSLTRKMKRIRALTVSKNDLTSTDFGGLYQELTATFGDLVKKTLDEIVEFRSSLIENRVRYNLEKERALNEEIQRVEKEMAALEEIRAGLLRRLDEKGDFDVIANTYEELVKQKTALTENEQRVEELNRSFTELQSLDAKISAEKVEIAQDLQTAQTRVDALRALFREIIDNAIFKTEEKEGNGYFDISPIASGRRDQVPFKVTIEVPRSDAIGRARLRLVAYDLMVFLNAVRTERPLPRFLVHDGVFHGMSKRTITDSLNFVHRESLKHPGFQYLATFNEDEIYIPDERSGVDGTFDFSVEDATVAHYWDSPRRDDLQKSFQVVLN